MEEITYSEFVDGLRNSEITRCCVFQCRCISGLSAISISKPEARLFSLFDTCRRAVNTILCCCEWNVCKCARDKADKLVAQRHIPSTLRVKVLDLSDVKSIYSRVLDTRDLYPNYVHWNDPSLSVENGFRNFGDHETGAVLRFTYQSSKHRLSDSYFINIRLLFDEYQLLKRNNTRKKHNNNISSNGDCHSGKSAGCYDYAIYLFLRSWEFRYGSAE